jgi:RNA polymerase sigma-70 factor (ECF subfamily)
VSQDQDIDQIARVIATDDRAAFGELVLRHQSMVRAFLRQLTHGDHAWADDLAQETFVTAYRTLARFRSDSTFSTWLLGIAHNQFRNARRRQKEVPTEDVASQMMDVEPSHASRSALQQDLAEALRQLSGDEQTALHLCYQQGLSHTEAADVLSWPAGTVKTHLLRGKEKLKKLMAAWNPKS